MNHHLHTLSTPERVLAGQTRMDSAVARE